ncbi:hypothetical protein CPB85DRAFT_1432544 [Mucidula mucida]|nr:hypothetical protein CPB85DRAFT_1432544 [Mucidula mucida]
MNVLVYTGPEVVAASLTHTLSILRALLTPNYTVQTISHRALQAQPWTASCALFVLPGCRELPSSIRAVSDYVERGGSFLGLGVGVKRVGSSLDDVGSLGLSLDSSKDDMPFRFYDRPSKSSITLSPVSDIPSEGTQTINVQASDGSAVDGLMSHASIVDFEDTQRSKILARFTDTSSAPHIAGVKLLIGDGHATFWGVSLEYPIGGNALEVNEERRRNLLRDMLSELGLKLPSSEDGNTLRPGPQLLVGHPSTPEIVSQVVRLILDTQDAAGKKLEDQNDTFLFHSSQESLDDLKVQCQADYLASDDPSVWQPKHIVVYSNGDQPQSGETPLFSIQKFFESLLVARAQEKCSAKDGSWGFGECLMYGEVVTSTQTMIDRNPSLLASLPTPFLSLASFQLAGRGRGSNIWLSPAGCLQFSLLLRVTLGEFPSNKLVFVQYLFALAVAEACRDDGVLGKRGEAVRIKWPNDIYAITSQGEMKKIGGILVSTNFVGGKCDIIIGSGTNVFNPPPILSLAQLQNPEDPPISMETTAATILAKFESMWSTFIQGNGSFEPFMDLYLERWLHSDQVVTLTTTTPHKAVRISGITTDYGLLRTVPQRTGWATGEEGFIDLQPDGNSFDLMAGMIRSKS